MNSVKNVLLPSGFYFLVFLLFYAGEASAARIKVACVGNSITENYNLPVETKYPTFLQQYLGTEGYEVKNYGISARTLLKKGDFPYWNEARYTEVLNWKPDIVIIKLGTNDAKPHNWAFKDDFKGNYIEFVQSFKNLSSQPKIYLCFPIPTFPDNWINSDDRIITGEMIPIIREVAQETGSEIIDLHTPFEGRINLVFDKVHPNAKGTNAMAQIICKKICPECPVPGGYFLQLASSDRTDHYSEITSDFGMQETEWIKLTDNDPVTDLYIESFVPGAYIQVKLDAPVKVTGYSLTSSVESSESSLKAWKVQGSTTGNRPWYPLNEQKNQQFDLSDTRVFEVSSDQPAYQYFRLVLSENSGDAALRMSEWQLFGYKGSLESSLTNNGGTISGQYAGFPGETIEKLNDRLVSTKYCVVDQNQVWMQYVSPVQTAIGKYSLTSANNLPERNPRSWTLSGSNNGSQWDVLDTQTDQEFMVRYNTLEYPVLSKEKYSMFRLNVTALNDGSTFQLAEWQIFAPDETNLTNVENIGDYRIAWFQDTRQLWVHTGENIIDKIELIDYSGKTVKFFCPGDGEFYYLPELQDGMYLVRVYAGNKSFSGKILKY